MASAQEIAEKVKALGFPQYANCFIKHSITGDVLPYMTQQNLTEIGIDQVGARLKIFNTFCSGKSVIAGAPPNRGAAPMKQAAPASMKQAAPAARPAPAAQPPPAAKSAAKPAAQPAPAPRPAASQQFGASLEDAYEAVPPSSKGIASTSQAVSGAKGYFGDDDYNPGYDRFSDQPPPMPPRKKVKLPPPMEYSKDLKNVSAANKKKKEEHDKMVKSLKVARKIAKYEHDVELGIAVGPPPELPHVDIDTSGLQTCPYCGRKMSDTAARHHIPTCPKRGTGAPPQRGGANVRASGPPPRGGGTKTATQKTRGRK